MNAGERMLTMTLLGVGVGLLANIAVTAAKIGVLLTQILEALK